MSMNIGVSDDQSARESRGKRESHGTTAAQKGAQKAVHLYVLLSDTGLVKIGRSRAPMKRKRGLQSNSGMRLYMVRVIRDQGHRERSILTALARHRHWGEWFKDSQEFRRLASEVIGVDLKFRHAAKADPDHQSGMAESIRRMCIKGKTDAEIAVWDDADEAYDQFARGEIEIEEFSQRWRAAGHPPLTGEEISYGP